jgi:hypothetical protein
LLRGRKRCLVARMRQFWIRRTLACSWKTKWLRWDASLCSATKTKATHQLKMVLSDEHLYSASSLRLPPSFVRPRTPSRLRSHDELLISPETLACALRIVGTLAPIARLFPVSRTSPWTSGTRLRRHYPKSDALSIHVSDLSS